MNPSDNYPDMNPHKSAITDPANRRQFFERLARSTAALATLPALLNPTAAFAADADAKTNRVVSGRVCTPRSGTARSIEGNLGSATVARWAAFPFLDHLWQQCLSGAATAGFIGENLRYDLESTTALTSVNRQPVAGATNVLGDGSTKTFINPPASDPAKFFRLKVRLE